MFRLLNALAIAVVLAVLGTVPAPAYDDGVPPVWRGALRPVPVESVELTRIEAAIEEYRLDSAWRARSEQASVYWVDDNGAATPKSACLSATPLSGASACSLATINSGVAAGDFVYLRAGTYNTRVAPGASGTEADRITYQGYADEVVTITNVGNFAGLFLDNRDYIRVFNLRFDTLYQLAWLHNGSSYNEVAFNMFQISTGPANGGFNIFSLSADPATANSHNWVHDNIITKGGTIDLTPTGTLGCDDSGGLFNIGQDTTIDWFSDYNTVEDNQFSYGAHHALKTNSRHNVVRNNFVHNEGAYFVALSPCTEALDADGEMAYCAPDGYFGNRAMTILNNHTVAGSNSDTFNLVERNRIGPGGLGSDGNGADGLTLGGERDIVRFNTMYNANENGIYFRASNNIADNIRAYFNTVFANGQGPQCRVDFNNGFWKGGVRLPGTADNNVFKFNLLYGNNNDPKSGGSGPGTAGYGKELNNNGTGNTIVPNWVTSSGYGQSTYGDPLFTNPSLADMTSTSIPDLSLQAGSGAIDTAGALTTMSGAGASTTSGTFADPTYFQYGERGSDLVRANGTMYADRVAIGTITNIARITNIDYTTGAVTFDQALTWSNGAGVWLYSDSSNTRVLYGTAPDYGAHEFNSSEQGPLRLRLRGPE